MRKSILVLLLCLFSEVAALAVPAYPKPRKVVQPDGTVITLQAHGDEFFSYVTTTDGTIVSKGTDGFYRPTGDDTKSIAAKAAAVKRWSMAHDANSWAPLNKSRKAAGKNYRGLVLLVNFNDCQFSRGNSKANAFYTKLMNNSGTIVDADQYYGLQRYTGSVRQYFSDNSYGTFAPEFDIVGPIDIDVSRYYINGLTNTFDLAERVMKAADEQVDFSRYDSDGDGITDMVYILYAGYSSNYQGNDERLVWPHAGNMNNRSDQKEAPVLDGKKIGRFACSAEFFGWEEDESRILDGIGVIVHEFSHVLGFMDHYDTTGGYQEHPNTWDVMAAGNYSEDYNRTPCGFNSYEKWVAGFSTPLDITDMAGENISLGAYNAEKDACILRSYQDHVSYFMENRQQTKWDKYLPGHGLLVWRVDSIRPEYWEGNYINVTTRACFRLVRACGTQGSFFTGVEDTDYDSFPGTHGVTELDNDDDVANLLSYDQYPCPVVLRDIAEDNGVITFRVEHDDNARNQPITYTLPKKFYAYAEKLVGEEWQPCTWALTTHTANDKLYIDNLLPNTDNISASGRDYTNGVYVEYTEANNIAHVINLTAQRVGLNNDYSTWLCDLYNVEQQGSGAFSMSLSRYGIPTINGENVILGYCTEKASAYLVSQKNVIDRLAQYRNITFSETPYNVDAITETTSPNHNRKFIKNGRLHIINNEKIYDVIGREMK